MKKEAKALLLTILTIVFVFVLMVASFIFGVFEVVAFSLLAWIGLYVFTMIIYDAILNSLN